MVSRLVARNIPEVDPPRLPCVLPAHSGDLAPMLSGSDLVVHATISQAQALISIPGGITETRALATNVRRFAGEGGPPPAWLVIVMEYDVRRMSSRPPPIYSSSAGSSNPTPSPGDPPTASSTACTAWSRSTTARCR